MKKILILVAVLAILPSFALAKGSFSSGRSSFSSSRSSSSFRSSTPARVSTPSKISTTTKTSTPAKVSTPKTPKITPKISAKPSKTTTKVTSPKAKNTVNGKTFSKKGAVVDSTYQPKFRGGYTAPMGSTVYYRESSMMDWLPFYLILSSQNAHREAVVSTPATATQPATETIVREEGTDTMYVVNWIVTILLVIGLGALIVYLVNKKTKNV